MLPKGPAQEAYPSIRTRGSANNSRCCRWCCSRVVRSCICVRCYDVRIIILVFVFTLSMFCFWVSRSPSLSISLSIRPGSQKSRPGHYYSLRSFFFFVCSCSGMHLGNLMVIRCSPSSAWPMAFSAYVYVILCIVRKTKD